VNTCAYCNLCLFVCNSVFTKLGRNHPNSTEHEETSTSSHMVHLTRRKPQKTTRSVDLEASTEFTIASLKMDAEAQVTLLTPTSSADDSDEAKDPQVVEADSSSSVSGVHLFWPFLLGVLCNSIVCVFAVSRPRFVCVWRREPSC